MKKLIKIEFIADSEDFKDENGEHSNEEIAEAVKCEFIEAGYKDAKVFVSNDVE